MVLKAEISNQEIAFCVREAGLSDEHIEQLIVKEAKKRREAAGLYEQAGRNELAANELAELAILEKYLPDQLSDDEIVTTIEEILKDIEPVMSNMGKIIMQLKPSLVRLLMERR